MRWTYSGRRLMHQETAFRSLATRTRAIPGRGEDFTLVQRRDLEFIRFNWACARPVGCARPARCSEADPRRTPGELDLTPSGALEEDRQRFGSKAFGNCAEPGLDSRRSSPFRCSTSPPGETGPRPLGAAPDSGALLPARTPGAITFDLVGIYAAGLPFRGFANSPGAPGHAGSSFNFDEPAPRQREVKGRLRPPRWGLVSLRPALRTARSSSATWASCCASRGLGDYRRQPAGGARRRRRCPAGAQPARPAAAGESP